MLIFVSTGLGDGIRSGRSVEAVMRSELRSVGTYNGVQICRKATSEDIDRVRAMGGHIPKESKNDHNS